MYGLDNVCLPDVYTELFCCTMVFVDLALVLTYLYMISSNIDTVIFSNSLLD